MNAFQSIRAAACAAAALLLATPADAQLFRAYLSLHGSDANPCSLPQPCRLLPAALAAVASGGEIWMLDSANYNTSTVNVNKSVTILAVPGALGSVVIASGGAIAIATAGVQVTLRNLNIVPLPGSAGPGVDMTDGAKLTIEQCNFTGMANQPSIHARAPAQVAVVDSTIQGAYWGIFAQDGATVRVHGTRFLGGLTGIHVNGTGASTTTVTVSRSVVSNNGTGLFANNEVLGSRVRLIVTDSVVDSNVTGIWARAVGGAVAESSVTRTMVTNSSISVRAEGAGATLVATGNTVSGGGGGLSAIAPAVFISSGNNAVRGNASNSDGTITVAPLI